LIFVLAANAVVIAITGVMLLQNDYYWLIGICIGLLAATEIMIAYTACKDPAIINLRLSSKE